MHALKAVALNGKLDEADWQRAPVSGDFTENMPRDKQPAHDKTEVHMLFDHEAVYFGVRVYDPDPSKIRTPYVRRDKVFGNQDNFIIWIDPTGARKFAQFFRINARGVLADGAWNEDALEEDFAPYFDFQAVHARLPDGWSAEFRIQWESPRLPHPAPKKLTFIVFRNQRRDTRIRSSSVVLGRDPSCYDGTGHVAPDCAALAVAAQRRHLRIRDHAAFAHASVVGNYGNTMPQLVTRNSRMSVQVLRGEPGIAADETLVSRIPSMARMMIRPSVVA